MRILLTGGTSGIGLAMAGQLAARGHSVYFTARDREKAENTLASMHAGSPSGESGFFIADHGSMEANRQLIAEVRERLPGLDILILNAGVYYDAFARSPEGWEMTFAVNHLAGFMLARGLIEMLLQSQDPRIIFTSSDMHFRVGKLSFDVFNSSRGFRGIDAYSRSKLCNVLCGYALAEQYKLTALSVFSHHPGLVKTNFAIKHTSALVSGGWRLISGFGISAEKGAETAVFLSTDPLARNNSGTYWDRCKMKRSSELSYSKTMQENLWAFSEEACA